MRAELAPVARLLEAAEGGRHPHRGVRVDRQHAGLHATRHAQCAGAIAGPDRPREPVHRVVGQANRLGLVAEREHGGDRSEHLLPGDAVLRGDRRQHCRREPVARTIRRLSPERDRRLAVQERADGLALLGGDQRSHLGPLVERVADAHRLHLPLEELEEAIEHALLHEDPRARAAILPRVAEHRKRRGSGGGLDVGVGEDHVRRLAPELQRHPLDRTGGTGGDRAPNLGRAGEGDLGDVRMLDEALPARAAGTNDDVDDAVRHPGLRGELGEAQRRQRRELGGLEHDGVAGGERRSELPRGDRQREVPRGDQTNDAQRLANGERLPTGNRDRLAEQPLGRPGVVAKGVDHHRHLPARVADRLAGIARLEH